MGVQVIASSYTDGPTLTAAATASLLPTYVPTTLPAGYWQIGRTWRITASGKISNVVTTPGTARFDLRMAAVTAWDSLAMPLNIVVKADVPWFLQIVLTCRSVGSGTSGTLIGGGYWISQSNILTAVPSTGPGPGGVIFPYNSAPAVGTGFDSTAALAIDFRWTQTAATGSITMQQFLIEQVTP